LKVIWLPDKLGGGGKEITGGRKGQRKKEKERLNAIKNRKDRKPKGDYSAKTGDHLRNTKGSDCAERS